MARTNDIFSLKTQDPHPGKNYHIFISGGLLVYFFCDIFDFQQFHVLHYQKDTQTTLWT